MRLKSIKLAGFKSFVDPTTVTFISNMTAVVGPNGCGKSNIIDAVRWVMGESSAKNLRGESMTDVIFNGSGGRQPVGQAVIELLFENNEGKLQGEYAAFSEISIKRKVTRDGTSQYYLNGAKCRRRDVTDIFLGTGMGPRSYAIIEQGMISKLIESKPEELRVYLEEAAGISKYKERRRETENRMKRTQENLARLSDIREELGKQLQHLKRQAAAAERYAIYKKDQRLVNAKLNVFNWRLFEEELAQKFILITELELKIEKTLYSKTSNENEIEFSRLSLDEKQELFNTTQAKYYQSGADVASLEQQQKFQKERLLEQDKALAAFEAEANTITQALNHETEMLGSVTIELEDTLPLLEEAEECAISYESELALKEDEMRTWQEGWDQFNAKSASTKQAAEIEQHKIQQFELHIKQLDERKQKLELEGVELLNWLQETEHSQLDSEKEALDLCVQSTQKESNELFPLLTQLRDSIACSETQISELFNELTQKKAVLTSLLTLQEASFGDSVQIQNKWLSSNGIDESKRLMGEISVLTGWELAVEHVLGFCLTAAIVDTFEELSSKDVESIGCSLTLVSNTASQEYKVKESTLATCVKGAGGLVGLLNLVKIAQSFDDAVKYLPYLQEGESIITSSGVWLSLNWIRFFTPDASQEGLVLRTKKIALLESEIPEIESCLHTKESITKELKEQLKDCEIKLRDLDGKLKALVQEQASLASSISTKMVQRDQYQQRITLTNENAAEIAKSIVSEKGKLLLSHEQLQIETDLLDNYVDERDDYLERRELLQKNIDDCRQESRSLQSKFHQLQLELQKKQNQKNMLNQSLTRTKEQFENNQLKMQQLNSMDKIDETVLEDIAIQLETLLELQLKNESSVSDVRIELEAVSRRLRAAEKERETFETLIQNSRNELSSLRLDAQALEMKRNNLAELVKHDNFSIEEILPLLNLIDSDITLTADLASLESKVQRLGAINLAAIDEYKNQSERKNYLDAQDAELMEALDTLLAAIRKIDKETRTRFKETYDKVNSGLQRLFPKIFGGGNAYLELTGDDLLETGITIIARPPGKKNATIHLLSGGEKSLTAIALIFAIFELNPAPFCMLDEVDAPLDDANVARFANMVKEMSEQVQFIYITHNKVSMEKADQLMGVTMHELGVSRLVSVDVDEAVAMVDV